MLRGNRIAIAMLCMSMSFIGSCGGTDPAARVTQPLGLPPVVLKAPPTEQTAVLGRIIAV